MVTTKEAIKDERRRKRQRVREEEEEVGKVRAREKKGWHDCKKRLIALTESKREEIVRKRRRKIGKDKVNERERE